MSKVEKFSRIAVKTITSGELMATIPNSDDHTLLPEWLPTDVYVGEFLLNTANSRLFMRTDYETIKRVAFYEEISGATSGVVGTSGTSGTSGSSGIDGNPNFDTYNDLYFDTMSNSLVSPNLIVNSGFTYLASGYGNGKILMSDNNGVLRYTDYSVNNEKYYILKGYTQNSSDVLPGYIGSDDFVKEFLDFEGNDCKIGSGWTFYKTSDNEFEIHNSKINQSGGTGIFVTTFYKITNNGSGVMSMSNFTPNIGPNIYNVGKIIFSNISNSSWGLTLGTDFYLVLGFREMPFLQNGYFI